METFAHCSNVSADIPLVGRSTVNVKRELRAKLAASLASGEHLQSHVHGRMHQGLTIWRH